MQLWREKKKSVVIVALAALALVTTFAVFDDKGLLDILRLEREKANLENEIALLERENKTLEEEVRLLKTDKQYIARIARKELGMVGKKEVIYIMEDKPGQGG
jgi:cell division protein FtsB